MRLSSIACAVLFGAISPALLASDAEQAVRQALQQLEPSLVVESVAPSPMPGLQEVRLQGGRLLYASPDGRFIINGHLLQLENGRALNLTQQYELRSLAVRINGIAREQMVIFSPAQPKTHITVFTDTDCGYCQKLHSEVPELNRRGIEVRYLAFPRGGPASPAYQTLANVWCAKDRQQAMNDAKSGRSVPRAECANPVLEQYALGQDIGIEGTPAIVLANGQLIPGYQPADVLAEAALQAQQAR